MATLPDPTDLAPIALAERLLTVLFDESPAPVVQDAALEIAKALMPYRQALRRQADLAARAVGSSA